LTRGIPRHPIVETVPGDGMLKRTEVWSGLAWLAFGIFVLAQGRALGHGTINEPGAGFALIWLGVLIMGLAAVVLLAAIKEPGALLSELWAGTRWGKVAIVVALLLAFGVLFEPLGFIVCGTALLLILMTVIDPVGLTRAIPLALIVPYGAWWLLAKGLKVQMPLGVLAPYLN
jgi:putative tricarboxylic transport membrane protein